MSIEASDKQCNLRHNGLEWTVLIVDCPDEPCEDVDQTNTCLDEDHDTSEYIYYITVPYVDLQPFKHVDAPLPAHSSGRGLYDIQHTIRQCFDANAGTRQPPSGSWHMLEDIVHSFCQRVQQCSMYPPKLDTVVSNYSNNDFKVTDLLGRLRAGFKL